MSNHCDMTCDGGVPGIDCDCVWPTGECGNCALEAQHPPDPCWRPGMPEDDEDDECSDDCDCTYQP